MTSTHFVSDEVLTVRVSAPPFLAYSVPATLTVLMPPVNVADVTDEASAGWVCRNVIMSATATGIARAEPMPNVLRFKVLSLLMRVRAPCLPFVWMTHPWGRERAQGGNHEPTTP